jgi:putative SOS response-associated peptidase YedK
MCGRYASTRSAADLATLFEALDETDDGLVADYNLAPTDPAPLVRRSARAAATVLSLARWGLVPAWAGDHSGGARMINARAETVATSRAFGPSLAARRCLVPADGWYEWVARGKATSARRSKQAYFMTRTDGGVLAFGGIWSVWGARPERRLTFSIITLPAQDGLELVHARMPLIIEPSRWLEWLVAPDPAPQVAPPSREYTAGIEMRPVSSAVGDVRNDGPELVRAIPAAPLGSSTMDTERPVLF